MRTTQGWGRPMGGSMESEGTRRAGALQHAEAAEHSGGLSRRQVLRAGAVVGAGMLWVAPVVSGLGLTAAHADSTSGTTSPPPPNSPPPPPNSPPPPPPPPSSPPSSPPPAGVQPVTLTTSPPQGVLGETFTNQPPTTADGGTPSAVLPFTGAAAPIKSATLIGAGLVVSGAAAIAASRHRPQPAVQATEVQTTTEPDAGE
jgi:hypothetical protein